MAENEDDLFELTGQYEPLTTRIKNILREYKDGIGIFKELIQNADDAGATTVKFLVDWRKGQTGSLFSPGMAECQGPALWAYNNATFSDEDFENINKLAGQTKEEDISKIGRFGLGFNAVYHLTDVPSFISRNRLVVFDPNTRHLKRPGIRINLAKKPSSLTRYSDQFQLYNGVFDCNIEKAKVSWMQWLQIQSYCSFNYDATLFRFPFRTAAQALTSNISKIAYSKDRIKAIVSSLCECASTLLIFSQHVKEVEVYELDEGSQPHSMRLVLSVNKPGVKMLGDERMKSAEPFIRQCSEWWEQYRDYKMGYSEYPIRCELVTIVTRNEPSELSCCKRRYICDQNWFVVSASGVDVSLEVARSPNGRERGYLPCGGVAFLFSKDSNENLQQQNVASNLCGELFCFLPMSIPTGLPVHVNGNFAIMSNRVGIWKRTIMQKQQIEVEWNEALMKDALARAYIMLLKIMREFIGYGRDYKFHSLWPNMYHVDMHSWKTLVTEVCSVLLDSDLFYSDGIWMSVNDGFLLSDDFDLQIYETSVEILRSLGIHVFDIPSNILLTLKNFDSRGILQRHTLNFGQFLGRHFFPNIQYLTTTQRDIIVCFGLDRILKGHSWCRITANERDLFRRNECIPVSEDSGILVKPCELVHPGGAAAILFSKDDHRFPVGNGLCDPNRLYVLETLGMVQDLDWEGILERAQSIASRNGLAHNDASRKLIKYLNDRINKLPKCTSYHKRFQGLNFLPVLRKPPDKYILPWKGSKNFWPRLCSPNEVFLPKDANLIGSSCLIIDTSESAGCGELNNEVKHLLGFSNRLPEDKLVFQQLDEAVKCWNRQSEKDKQEAKTRFAIQTVCNKIYEFFNSRIENKQNQSNQKKKIKQDLQFFDNRREILEKLKKQDWLFIDGRFVQTKKVAYTCKGTGAPYLYALPPDYARDYRHLFEAMEIKDNFQDEDFICALNDLSRAKKGSVLTEDELQIALFFITQINVENDTVKAKSGEIPLPDTNSILRLSRDVVVNLDLWQDDPDGKLKVHEKIPQKTAHHLGARSLKSVILKTHANRIGYGESFGQQEDLTDRLKGILDGYPIDGILKELLQNADDAQASEIHFIHDTRSLESKKVATDQKSDEIQGPALCVYNDKPFGKEDLDGIRKLGTGRKQNSPEMTGKYGIGFNSVYHLTDCPSFLSDDDTLAFLDPHCRHFGNSDRGQLFNLKLADERFRNNISDTLSGYLPEHFNLHGSTMFRFPLRRGGSESKISNNSPNVEELFQTFQKEARRSLLFLNHVKKITLSKIHSSNKLEEISRVESIMTAEDEKKRQELTQKIYGIGPTSVTEVRWKSVSYVLNIQENQKYVEKWLIQRCTGADNEAVDMNEIANGRELGLLPRGGLAARLWTRSNEKPLRGIVYCFLPLPENYTNLPVHVNGHFALDNHRRRLWTNTDDEGPKCKWNHFINTCVLPPAYAALIQEARTHLCNDETDNQLSHYHALFPNVLGDSPWRTLTIELYRYLGRTNAKVFPLLVPTETETSPSSRTLKKAPNNSRENLENRNKENPKTINISEPRKPVHVSRSGWLSADEAYFTKSSLKDNLLHLLLRIGVPVLLHTPYRIYCSFETACISRPYEVTEKSVISFLRDFTSKQSTCKITNLPKKLETTAIKTVPELSELINYCRGDKDFGTQLEGLPLLLTQDGCLRVFKSSQRVFRSKFGDLFPARLHSFVHSKIVHQIPLKAIESEENIVINLTVNDLPDLLQQVFTKQILTAIKDDKTWKNPVEGTLSKRWLKKFWNFLQNYTMTEPNEHFVSLECLSEWPVIPTTHGKLVTIKDAKTVLDMTTTGNESILQTNVRTFLINLNSPVLDKVITFKNKYTSSEDQTTEKKIGSALERKPAVTDAYVAHPHNALDVLLVLTHMLKTKRLDLTKLHEEEIRGFLQFVQDNYQGPKEHKQLVKGLPFYKAFNGQFVSLTGLHSSCAIIPSSIPTEQVDQLQERTRCLFLNSDVLPALEKLYKELGVNYSEDVTKFYTEFVFKHFDIFTRETQVKHLTYIRDQIHLSLPQGTALENSMFLKTMAHTACIPDEDGRLHKASEFFDQNNIVFSKMYEGDNNKYLPPPFNQKTWSCLLEDIGLQVVITPELFLQFCATVAKNGKHFPDNRQSRVQSEVLVKCLFNERSLQENDELLFRVSQLEFVVQAKVEEKLSSIHEQYQYSPFVKFCGAVPWHFRHLAWTSAAILPIWTEPNNVAKLKALNSAWSGPTYTDVLDHLQNVITSYNHEAVDCSLMHEITKAVYQYLCKSTQCCDHVSNDECDEICNNIAAQLKDVSCIYLQKYKVFVKGEQMVFRLPDNCDLKPFLYSVPREFGELEHLLKRLGATDRPTPKQITDVLNSIRQKFGDGLLTPEVVRIVKHSMYMLFQSLHKGMPADEIDILYLLSQSKQLVKSCEMICKVSSRYTDLIEQLQRPILLRLGECGLKKASDDYVDALPDHLRPKKFDELFREVVAPECRNSVCSDHDQRSFICTFLQRYDNLLTSDEFQEGLQRLLLHDHQDPHDYKQRIKKLQTDVQTKCIGTDCIKINIINRDTNEVIANLEESCFAVQDKDAWTMYIQHEFEDDLVSMACCVDKILGDCIHQKIGLIKMLGCFSPGGISRKLNGLGIALMHSESDDEYIPPDDEDPLSASDSETREERVYGGDGAHVRTEDKVEDEIFYSMNRLEAIRWLKQSKSDLAGAKWLLQSGPPFNALACFDSHEVVEKCLKAMLYHYCGISNSLLGSHRVLDLAECLRKETGRPDETTMDSVRKVSRYYLSTRYPNRQPFDVVPADAFDLDEAEEAVDAASKVFEYVKNCLEE